MANPGRPPATWWLAVLLLAGIAGGLYAIRLDAAGFYDSEAHLAEVSREMYLSGDYISPRLDGILFLNKPPLLFWLTGLAFRVTGPTEWGRVVTVLAAVLTLVVTARLGARLFSPAIGLLAAFVLATTVGFVLEARTLRPDLLVVLSVATAILCWHLADAAPVPSAAWLAAGYAALGAGMMAKGLVPGIVAGIPIGLTMLRRHGWRHALVRLRPGLGLAVLGVLVVPWHLLVAWRHPGFAWDYVVNQHVLFFLDRKFPRDSRGIPLATFWAAFLGRAMPWVLLAPLSAPEAAAACRRGAAPPAEGSLLLWTWLLGVPLFFSLSPSRLEHYTVPALPAAALLAARGLGRLRTESTRASAWRVPSVAAGLLVALGLTCLLAGRPLLVRLGPAAEAPAVLSFVPPAGLACVAGGLALLLGARRRDARTVTAGMALAAVPLAAIAVGALISLEPLMSWRPFVRTLLERLPPDAAIVLEAPEEYQVVGGLAFYAARTIPLLPVPGFIAPAYLEPYRDTLFLSHDELWRRWAGPEPIALVSNPQLVRESPEGWAPAPRHVVMRWRGLWAVANVPPAAAPRAPDAQASAAARQRSQYSR